MTFGKKIIAAALAVTAFSGVAQANDAQLYREIAKYDNVAERAAEVTRKYAGFMSSFEADIERGQLVYSFEVLQHAKKRTVEVSINAKTGKMTKPEYERISRDEPTADEIITMISLVDALEAAEGSLGKHAVAADLSFEGNLQNQAFVYEVDVLKRNGKLEADVEAHTGEIMQPGWDIELEDIFDRDDKDNDRDDKDDRDDEDDDRDDRFDRD